MKIVFRCVRLLSVLLCLGALFQPLSTEARVVAAAVAVLAICGGEHAPLRFRRAAVAAAVLLLVMPVYTVLSTSEPRHGSFALRPEDSYSLVSAAVQEEDGVHLIIPVLKALGGITPREATGLYPALERGYRRMRDEEGRFPTPFVRDYLGLQRPKAFDLLTFALPDSRPPRAAAIFLHGSGGAWSLLCYLLAVELRKLDIVTLCPAIGPSAKWGSGKGRKIIEATIRDAQLLGVERLYLMGLSAGAVGAAKRASEFQTDLHGLVLLFGGASDAPPHDLATLIIYASHDDRFPADWIERVAGRYGDSATSVRLEGDHFSILKQPELTGAAIRSWLQASSHNGRSSAATTEAVDVNGG